MAKDKQQEYEEAVWPNSGHYPASCLEELGERKKTLSQENHFPPEIQIRYATNTSQKHYSFSQLVCTHAQNLYLYLMWTEYSNIFGFTNSARMYKTYPIFTDATTEVQ